MNTFKRKALFTAVAAGLGVAGNAEAVYLNPLGTGQVLLYPYYTTQAVGGSAFNTLFTIVNTSSRAKAVKVRFNDGKTSTEVLDFNVYLSPNDVWTAAVVPSTNGVGAAILVGDSGASHPSPDQSCVAPQQLSNFPNGVDFRNYNFVANVGGVGLPGIGLDRTREGYIEVITMADIVGATALAVTHSQSTGIPPGCATVQNLDTLATLPATGDLTVPTGGLMGSATLLNVTGGLAATYKADALEAWSNAVQWVQSGSPGPSLSAALPPVSLVINSGGIAASGASMNATAYLSTFVATGGTSAGAKAVASVFMHSAVMNEYVLETGTRSQTDWVLTHPGKNFFVSSGGAVAPFTAVLTASGACEPISFTFFNRDERVQGTNPGDFSPAPPGAPSSTLCFEANVLSLRNGPPAIGQPTGLTSGVLGSTNATAVQLGTNAQFPSGWAVLQFTGASATGVGLASVAPTQRVPLNMDAPPVVAPVAISAPVTFFGLPVTGFSVRNFSNGAISCTGAAGNATTCSATFGALVNHSYLNFIVP